MLWLLLLNARRTQARRARATGTGRVNVLSSRRPARWSASTVPGRSDAPSVHDPWQNPFCGVVRCTLLTEIGPQMAKNGAPRAPKVGKWGLKSTPPSRLNLFFQNPYGVDKVLRRQPGVPECGLEALVAEPLAHDLEADAPLHEPI